MRILQRLAYRWLRRRLYSASYRRALAAPEWPDLEDRAGN